METTPKQRLIDGFEQSGLAYGDIINHSDINAWADIEYPDLDGLSREQQQQAINRHALDRLVAVDGLREYLLLERRMYLASVHGSGYRIVQPAEQTEAAVAKGMAQVKKGLRHAQRGVEQVNDAMLTTSEREYNRSVKARLQGLARMVGPKRSYLDFQK